MGSCVRRPKGAFSWGDPLRLVFSVLWGNFFEWAVLVLLGVLAGGQCGLSMAGEEDYGRTRGNWCLTRRLPLYLLDLEGLQESESTDILPQPLPWPWPVASLTT